MTDLSTKFDEKNQTSPEKNELAAWLNLLLKNAMENDCVSNEPEDTRFVQAVLRVVDRAAVAEGLAVTDKKRKPKWS